MVTFQKLMGMYFPFDLLTNIREGGPVKLFNHFLFTILLSFVIYSIGYSQNLAVTHNSNAQSSPQSVTGLVYVHYDGDNAGNSVGDGGTTFIGGARFRASIMGTYTGGTLQTVQFFYSQAATGLTIMIYDAGTATDPGTLLLSQPLDLGSLTLGDWNEITLTSAIPISGNDLWVCLQVEDATAANYPFGVDAGPADPDGDFVNDSGVWQHLNDFGLNYNWNIRGGVQAPTGGGTVIFSDNFDSYTAGQQLACQNSTDWTTWNSAPCDPTTDPYISNTYSHSTANSVNIVDDNDLVHTIDNYTSGKYEISFYMYIPSGEDAYWNTLQSFAGSSSLWGMEALYPVGGVCTLNAGGNAASTFAFSYDTWMFNELIVDLDNDLATLKVDGTEVYSWQWSLGATGSGGILQLGGNDFYGYNQTGGSSYYMDDYTVTNLAPVPVELTSFTAASADGNVTLNWSTATETNNHMFEIQRQLTGNQFVTVGYVNGQGTTTQPHDYTYTDSKVPAGTYSYRLKQIDFNGTGTYSNTVEVKVTPPLTFGLEQNYPNPFNPTTNINFSVAKSGFVKLAVYNILGQEVRILVNENKDAGFYTVNFDASNLPSGTYIYKLQSGNSVSVKKMMLLK